MTNKNSKLQGRKKGNMSEEERRTVKTDTFESQSSVGLAERKPKTSKWAKTSLWCGLFAWVLPVGILLFVTLLDMCFFLPLSLRGRKILEEFLGRMMFIVPPALGITALISGVVGLIVIISKKGAVKGTGKAVGGIVLSLIFFALVWGVFMLGRVRNTARDVMCREQLSDLGKAMQMYANDYNGQYPTPDKWFDLLIEYADVSEGYLVDPVSETERRYYAMNPNAEPNSPGDIVLLFEAIGGWNQFGGPEILAIGNHLRNKCNILFNDGHVESVKKKQLDELKWGDKK